MEFAPTGSGVQYGFRKFGAAGNSSAPSIVIYYDEDISLEGGIYILKNVATGKYLDVYNGNTSSGTSCIQYTRNGAFNQQWQVRVVEDGVYTLRPMNAVSKSCAMGVTGNSSALLTTVTIQSFNTYASPQQAIKWKIVPNNDDSDSYRLMSFSSSNRLCLSSATGGQNMYQWTYSASGDDQWVFEPITYEYNTVAIEDSEHGYSHSQVHDNIIPNGYCHTVYTDITGSEALEILKDSTVFISRSHGYSDGIACANNTCLTTNMISGLSAGALKGVRLVCYAACNTGEGDLVSTTYQKGARTVIGFHNAVYCHETHYWLEKFMSELANGSTISVAMNAADIDVQGGHDGLPVYNSTESRAVCGIENEDILYYAP